ncbi:hypothetical protein C8R46DRAFT_241875 [Mycena filopes]|nr:hypothetical protein C8R46DRAFT_241875 [Mycena filopes]
MGCSASSPLRHRPRPRPHKPQPYLDPVISMADGAYLRVCEKEIPSDFGNKLDGCASPPPSTLVIALVHKPASPRLFIDGVGAYRVGRSVTGCNECAGFDDRFARGLGRGRAKARGMLLVSVAGVALDHAASVDTLFFAQKNDVLQIFELGLQCVPAPSPSSPASSSSPTSPRPSMARAPSGSTQRFSAIWMANLNCRQWICRRAGARRGRSGDECEVL